MKKTFLLTAITIISVTTASTLSAQYYNRGYKNDNHGYQQENRWHGDYRDNRFQRDERRQFHEIRDMENDRRRIAALQYAMEDDRNCGNWDAYHYHEAQLQDLCNDIRRDHERMEYGHERDEHRHF